MIAKGFWTFAEFFVFLGVFFLFNWITNLQHAFQLSVMMFVLSPVILFFLGFYEIRKKELTEIDKIYKQGF